VVAAGLLTFALADTAFASNWPGFRGHGDSIAVARDLPLHWSASSNLAWRVDLAGPGQSSPIVWGDTVYTTSATGPRKEDIVVQAIHAATGLERWRHTRPSANPEAVSETRSHAAPTPVAAPEGLYALFESGDCFALDHAGQVRWHRNLSTEFGEISSNHGLGGSPALAPDVLVLALDQERPSCVVALDRSTGATRWRTPRPGRTAWSSPLVVGDGHTAQVILSGGGTLNGYLARTGEPLWSVGGFVRNLVPSPTLHAALLVVGAGSKGSNVAFDWTGSTNAPVERWRADDVASGFASPLAHSGRVYFVGTAGVLACRDAASGRPLFEERVAQSSWASPVGAGDRIYVFGDRGATTVLRADDRFLPLATNELGFASKVVGVAVSDGAFLIRAYGELARLGMPRDLNRVAAETE